MKTIKIFFLIVTLTASVGPVSGQMDNNFRNNLSKAYSVNSADECLPSLKFCEEVLKVKPDHPIVNYLTARLNAILGNEDTSVKYLLRATNLGYITNLPFNKIHQLNDAAFSKLRNKKEFDKITEALEKAENPIHKSEIAFILGEKDLLPEGIAYDPVEKMFYLGSETKQKIVKVDQYGNCTDFIKQGENGSTVVILGIHVDSVRRNLWACFFDKTRRGIYKYSLTTGKLIKEYIEPPSSRCGFNDLVIHPNGDVYISDGTRSSIYKINHSSDTLELFLKDVSIIAPNGITLSGDGSTIYLADTMVGIYKIDINSKSLVLLSHSLEFSTYGIDGLYFRNDTLYAVQISLNQVSKFSLTKNGTHVEKCEILERNSQYLFKPTTGVIVDDYFYFIADTGAKAFKQEGIIVMKAHFK